MAWKNFRWGRIRHGNLGHPESSEITPEEKYFVQKLDHFDPTNTKTWNQVRIAGLFSLINAFFCARTILLLLQRYFVNDSFYQPNGPFFLMIGGEGEASPKWMVNGTWLDYAKKYNAYCVMVEHRFYGKSHPTE